jgi:1-deoxy-D-xylulose-5-phosphate synthase
MSRYLTRLSTSPAYNRIHHDLEKFFTSLPHGQEMHYMWTKWKRETKDFFVESSLFEKFGVRYIGPIDGHNIEELIKNLEFAKKCDGPVIIHVLTKKGMGLEVAMTQPERFHGLGPFDPKTGQSTKPAPGSPPNYQDVFGQALVRLAKADPKVVGITAAMASGTGMSHLASACPKQFFDVGIAEEHAVLFAAGLATRGIRPVVAIYSTFIQRCFDQIVHDVCLQNLPVVFCLDRAGLSPQDGPTHHGLFDLSFLRCVPNAILMQPRDEDELVDMLSGALKLQAPVFIRYPRGPGTGIPIKPEPGLIEVGVAEQIKEGHQIAIWALGPMIAEAGKLAARLEEEDKLSVTVVNARFAKPLDTFLLLKHAASHKLLVTMEDNVITGGFGSAVLEALQEAHSTIAVERIGWPDHFIEHGSSVDSLRSAHGLSTEAILTRLRKRFGSL